MSKLNQTCDTCNRPLDPGHFPEGSLTCESCIRWQDQTPPYEIPTVAGTKMVVSLDGDVQIDNEGCRWSASPGRLGLFWAEGEDSLKGLMQPGPKGAPSDGSRRQPRPLRTWDSPRGLDALEHPAPSED